MNGYYTATVSEVDAIAGKIKVAFAPPDDTVSEWLPMLAHEYQMPGIGTTVAVVINENGNGVVLGTIYNNAQNPPAISGYKKVYPGGVEITATDANFSIKFNGSNYISYNNGMLSIRADYIDIIRNIKND